MRGASTLKSVSRSRSLVGRVLNPGGASMVRERYIPAMIRIDYEDKAGNSSQLIVRSSQLRVVRSQFRRGEQWRRGGGCGLRTMDLLAPRSLYNRCMRGWSIPLGRWMGVEMRVHIFFPLLVLVLFAISGADGWPRGLALFFILVAAVVTRETSTGAGGCVARPAPPRHSAAAHRRPVCLRQPGKPGEGQPGRRAVCPGAGRPAGKLVCGTDHCGPHSGRQRRCAAFRFSAYHHRLSAAQHGLDAGLSWAAPPAARLSAGLRPR